MNIDNRPNRNRMRGSWPRCQAFVQGSSEDVAARLTRLADFPGVIVTSDEKWMPNSSSSKECRLGDAAGFLEETKRKEVIEWWLKCKSGANTPNWDLASKCTIWGAQGLLLVEAKAHAAELHNGGKRCVINNEGNAESARRSRENHARIGAAITEASDELKKIDGGFNLTLNSHYQLANRFAWSWKVASMGIPVLLIYLGFIEAQEMRVPFVDAEDWTRVLLNHSDGIVPAHAWGRTIALQMPGAASFTPLIRSAFVPHPAK
jgi:hypothetical protein